LYDIILKKQRWILSSLSIRLICLGFQMTDAYSNID
jgi:hypothetical protein